MTKAELKKIVDEHKGGLAALEKRLAELIDNEETSYEDIEAVCKDVPGMYDEHPNFTARDQVRVDNELFERHGLPPAAYAL